MKTRKLNGFGSLGVEIYDIDLKTCSDDELLEVGKIVIDQLVVYVNSETCSLNPSRLNHIAKIFGDPFGGIDQSAYKIVEYKKKHNLLSRADLQTLKELKKIRLGLEEYDGMIRVTGKKDDEGDYVGMFADGELDWHSDRQGTGNFSPLIMLMAQEQTEGTCTDFLQTCDAYEDLPKSDKNLFDELIAIHRYLPNKIAPGLNKSQDNIVRMNMCPIDNSEVPLVCYSPGGRKGIRLSYNTIVGFKNKTDTESNEIIEFMKHWFLQDKYAYRQNWKNGEMIFMDQTVTVHRRPTKDCSKRVMIRQTCNFDNILKRGTQGLQNLGNDPGIIVDGRKLSSSEYIEKVQFVSNY